VETDRYCALLTPADIADGDSRLKQKNVDALRLAAPDFIPGWIRLRTCYAQGTRCRNIPKADTFAPLTLTGGNDGRAAW
jgi:hypothetical protein